MNLLDELARTDIDPAMLAKVRALVEQQQVQLAEKDFKITALTHELAYLKRIRYGKASEVLSGEQRSLFEEAVDMDLAAIEGKLESQASSKPARKRAGRQSLPPELPRIENRHDRRHPRQAANLPEQPNLFAAAICRLYAGLTLP
ncbi:hypothetical protein MasN3_42160 [Massilia varians]|uniref:Transposase TnpC homeodomain domain-containing protein n=1 Tax=Massilia varians TaxID=457921 RepID=A0ABM8CBR3_9BURK|nr:transposase [Massilia varians]BDT60722.1 hypothetical protein MasN3_42160 [Massilia varians]